MPMKVILTYFRASGKFYCHAEYETQMKSLLDIWEEVRNMRDTGTLPALVDGHSKDYHITVDVPDHPHRHPCLLLAGK